MVTESDIENAKAFIRISGVEGLMRRDGITKEEAEKLFDYIWSKPCPFRLPSFEEL